MLKGELSWRYDIITWIFFSVSFLSAGSLFLSLIGLWPRVEMQQVSGWFKRKNFKNCLIPELDSPSSINSGKSQTTTFPRCPMAETSAETNVR